MLAQRYQKKMLKCNKNNYVYKKTIIIIKSTDISPQKRLKHGRQNISLHWINGIIRNNKCIITKLNAVFILKTVAWTKTYIQRLIPSQIPDRISWTGGLMKENTVLNF
jgi:hypothetical protein